MATVHGVAELDSTEQLSVEQHNEIFLDLNSNLELFRRLEKSKCSSIDFVKLSLITGSKLKKSVRNQKPEAVLRWWRNRMGRPLSSPQIH